MEVEQERNSRMMQGIASSMVYLAVNNMKTRRGKNPAMKMRKK